MNNFVAKHNYNRPAVHSSLKDYTRVSMRATDFDLYDEDIEPPIVL